MDPAGRREVTRAPEERDLIALARELNRNGARYVVIGGLAIIRLGYLRATEDVDLLIAKDRENQLKVRRALEILPDQAIREFGDDEDMAAWAVVRVNDAFTIDLMTEATGIGYDEAEEEIEWVEMGGEKIPFASAKLMLRFKQGNIREKDALDRAYLEAKLRGEEGT